MAKRIAINGFGRIGRLTFRNLLKKKGIQVVAVNDLTDNKTLAHLLKYDTTQGKFAGKVSADDEFIYVDDQKIVATAIRNPEELPWKELDVDVVLECTGIFRSVEKAGMHLTAGAKRVVISAPAKGSGVPTFVIGVNQDSLTPADKIVSNASCTTNCLVPMVVTLDKSFGIEQFFMTTVHAYTGDQNILDAPHSDLRRARAAAQNIVPTSTGAESAVVAVAPHLKGKVAAYAIRVPVPTGSLIDMVCTLKKEASIDQINEAFREASEGNLKNVLEYCTDPIVSSDIIQNKHSCIFDAGLTQVNGKTCRIVGWYDNEAGYSARLADLTEMMAHQ